MFATKRGSNQLRWRIISYRCYMVIRSKTAKRLQNITANKRKREKQERLKSRYKEYFEDVPIPTAFNARNPLQIACRYLLTQQRDPLPQYIIKKIEICSNVRITALYKQSPSVLLKLPNILNQLKENADGIISSHANLLQEMISRSFLLTNQEHNKSTIKHKKSQSEINLFIGSVLFEGRRDDVKHALQLYNYIKNMRQECTLKIPGIPNHILQHLALDNRTVFFSRKRSLSKFNDLLYDIKHPNSRRIKRFIDPAVTEKDKYIQTMKEKEKIKMDNNNNQRLIADDVVTDTQMIQQRNNGNNNNDLVYIESKELMPSVLTENRLQKLSKFVESYLLSDRFTRQSDGTTDLVLYGNQSCKQLVQRKMNELSKSCFTLLVGDKKLPIILWQFPWIYWKVFTLTQSRAWEDFNKPGILWLHGPEKWRTLKATKFLQTFFEQIDVIDIDPRYYAAIVGYKGKMIENLGIECGATIFTYKHSKERIAKNELKEKETAEMMMRWRQRKLKKYGELEKKDKDPMSTAGMWKKWRIKTKDPIKEKQSIQAQIEKLTNTRKWITPKIDFNKEWENKLMIFGDKEAKNAVRKYVNDIVSKTYIMPLTDLQFRAIFQSTNYDKQKKEYMIKMEKKRKKKIKDYKNKRLQIRIHQLDVDENNNNDELDDDEYNDDDVVEIEPFIYRYEKIHHSALIQKLERELECILTFDDSNNLYISNAKDPEQVKKRLNILCRRYVWRAFNGFNEIEFDSNLQQLNKAIIKNKQISWFLMDPLHNNEFKEVLMKYRGLPFFWNNRKCELSFYGLKEMVDALNKDIQIYLQQFAMIKMDDIDINNWMSIPHEKIKENVKIIYQETGVKVFNLKKGIPILISKDINNLEIAKELLLNLYESVECIYINPKQLEVAENIVNELQNKYECDIIINPIKNENQEHAVNIIYHNQELRDKLINEMNQYLSQHELLRFNYNDYISHLDLNDFSFPMEFKESILNPLSKYYDVIINSMDMNEIKVLGNPENVQLIKKVLIRFCKNIRGMYVDNKLKGPLIYRFLIKYQQQYPSIYFWWNESKQCVWSSILPIAIRQQTEDNIINTYIDNDIQQQQQQPATTNELMTDTITLQHQFDLFTKYLDHANKYLVSLDLGRHLQILLEPNLPFELDTIEYLKEEKELDKLMMMNDDEYDIELKRKQKQKYEEMEKNKTESTESKETKESRIEMIEKMSSVDLSVDGENNIIHFLGTENQMNIAYDLIKDILRNIQYIEINEYDAAILGHDYFSITHGDIEMSHKSLLTYISDECQVTLDLIQAFQDEINSLNVNNWNENVYKQQVNMATNVTNDDCTELLLLNNNNQQKTTNITNNRIIPNLYIVVYGNEMRQKMVKDKLNHFISTIQLDTNSNIKTHNELEKLNRNQRRLLFDLFRVKRAKKEKQMKKKLNQNSFLSN